MKTKHKDRRIQSAKPSQKPDASEEVPFAAKFRDFVEQIAIAIVLALLFRGFEGEAFVIPTGSMAPTLMGMHKDIRCDKCGYEIRTGATEDRENIRLVRNVTCPVCRYVNPIDTSRKNHISFSGDRIVVNKFAYQFSDPKRWDVIVFKFPGNPKQNYIKRLVGLPGETIGIKYGDVYRYDREQGYDGGQGSILRKPPAKIERLLQVVHDSDYMADELVNAGWPSPWQPASNDKIWTTAADQRSYQLGPATDTVAWLNYRQLPHAAAWQAMGRGKSITDLSTRGELITDFCGYNSYPFTPGFSGEGLHWVGDLAVECEIDVISPTGELWFDLIEGGRHHTCRIDVSTGEAVLAIDDGKTLFDGGNKPAGQLTGQTKIRKPGRYDVRLANVDNELVLWLNGRVVSLQSDGETQPGYYSVPPGERPVWSRADPGDLEPVRIGGKNVELAVRELKVLRDVYYVAADNTGIMPQNACDYDGPVDYERLRRLFTSPERWATSNIFDLRRSDVEFQLGENQFFPLGDNSPQSKDARLWHGNQTAYLDDQFPHVINVNHYVERERLIGKAFLVYWPHPWQIKSGVRPIIPNVKRMGRIR